MCSSAKCRTCGKTTWRGCGQHVDQVRRTVPAAQWCKGHAKEETTGGFWSRLTGRV